MLFSATMSGDPYKGQLILKYPEIAMCAPLRKNLRRRFITLAFWLVGGANFVAAQQLPLKSYTTADGLAHNGVNRIVKDSRGFLWFCTREGLSRFDGYSFTNYGVEQGLPSAEVNDLLQTREGEYWVATGGGLCRLNPLGQPNLSGNSTKIPGNALFDVFFPGEDPRSRYVLS